LHRGRGNDQRAGKRACAQQGSAARGTRVNRTEFHCKLPYSRRALLTQHPNFTVAACGQQSISPT
jgi:hypothetical protein